jgi:MiaB/RimO family radical SAM methylthiotransferase
LVPTIDRLVAGSHGTNWAPVEVRRRPVMDILNSVNRSIPTLPYAYVKVAEGCDKPCTFCAIPLIRGGQRSRRPIEIRDEMALLVAGGVSEIVLVAQDLAAYGRDADEAWNIVDLVRFVADIDGLERIRLLYLYPKEIRPALIEEMASNPKVASYFDLSLQHASGRLLRDMKRPGDGDRHMRLIEDIRRADPDAALRSSFIVGFPGETEDEVDELQGFLEAARLDWAGFFPYSAEAGTPAAELDGRLDRQTVTERLRTLQQMQEEMTAEANLAMVGRRLAVLVDQVEDGVPVGRSYREAPEIDGMITLDAGEPGRWVQAEIVGAFGPDMDAVVVG